MFLVVCAPLTLVTHSFPAWQSWITHKEDKNPSIQKESFSSCVMNPTPVLVAMMYRYVTNTTPYCYLRKMRLRLQSKVRCLMFHRLLRCMYPWLSYLLKTKMSRYNYKLSFERNHRCFALQCIMMQLRCRLSILIFSPLEVFPRCSRMFRCKIQCC